MSDPNLSWLRFLFGALIGFNISLYFHELINQRSLGATFQNVLNGDILGLLAFTSSFIVLTLIFWFVIYAMSRRV